jgi:hypothetical protein
MLTQGVRTIFIDQLPTFHVLKKGTYYYIIKIFNSLPLNLKSLMNKKIQFKVTLKRYLNTPLFYSVDESLCLKITHNLWKSFLSLCSVIHQLYMCGFSVTFVHYIWKLYFRWNLYILNCICLYILYFYELFHILLSFWLTFGSLECILICTVCICVRAHMYVCMYIYARMYVCMCCVCVCVCVCMYACMSNFQEWFHHLISRCCLSSCLNWLELFS